MNLLKSNVWDEFFKNLNNEIFKEKGIDFLIDDVEKQYEELLESNDNLLDFINKLSIAQSKRDKIQLISIYHTSKKAGKSLDFTKELLLIKQKFTSHILNTEVYDINDLVFNSYLVIKYNEILKDLNCKTNLCYDLSYLLDPKSNEICVNFIDHIKIVYNTNIASNPTRFAKFIHKNFIPENDRDLINITFLYLLSVSMNKIKTFDSSISTLFSLETYDIIFTHLLIKLCNENLAYKHIDFTFDSVDNIYTEIIKNNDQFSNFIKENFNASTERDRAYLIMLYVTFIQVNFSEEYNRVVDSILDIIKENSSTPDKNNDLISLITTKSILFELSNLDNNDDLYTNFNLEEYYKKSCAESPVLKFLNTNLNPSTDRDKLYLIFMEKTAKKSNKSIINMYVAVINQLYDKFYIFGKEEELYYNDLENKGLKYNFLLQCYMKNSEILFDKEDIDLSINTIDEIYNYLITNPTLFEFHINNNYKPKKLIDKLFLIKAYLSLKTVEDRYNFVEASFKIKFNLMGSSNEIDSDLYLEQMYLWTLIYLNRDIINKSDNLNPLTSLDTLYSFIMEKCDTNFSNFVYDNLEVSTNLDKIYILDIYFDSIERYSYFNNINEYGSYLRYSNFRNKINSLSEQEINISNSNSNQD